MTRALILHEDQEQWAEEVKAAIAHACGLAWLDCNKVVCVEELPEHGDDELTAGLLLATAARRDDERLVAALEVALAAGVVVVPVVRADDDFLTVVPEALHPINALPWREGGHDVAQYVLAALGLGEAERQVFISYRRQDAAYIAEALWHRLSERRFDVFLDRFSVPPGLDFQARLRTELAEKAFVVVLESESAAGAKWVEYEVHYALSHQIGLLAITLPGVAPQQRFGSIHDAFRVALTDDDIREQDGVPRLKDGPLDELVREIERAHEAVFVRRRAQLVGSARLELERAGWDVSELPEWSLVARRDPIATQVLRVTPRAPRPADLLELDRLRAHVAGATGSAAGTGRVVHNTLDTDADAMELIDWISSGRDLKTTPLSLLAQAIAGADR